MWHNFILKICTVRPILWHTWHRGWPSTELYLKKIQLGKSLKIIHSFVEIFENNVHLGPGAELGGSRRGNCPPTLPQAQHQTQLCICCHTSIIISTVLICCHTSVIISTFLCIVYLDVLFSFLIIFLMLLSQNCFFPLWYTNHKSISSKFSKFLYCLENEQWLLLFNYSFFQIHFPIDSLSHYLSHLNIISSFILYYFFLSSFILSIFIPNNYIFQ